MCSPHASTKQMNGEMDKENNIWDGEFIDGFSFLLRDYPTRAMVMHIARIEKLVMTMLHLLKSNHCCHRRKKKQRWIWPGSRLRAIAHLGLTNWDANCRHSGGNSPVGVRSTIMGHGWPGSHPGGIRDPGGIMPPGGTTIIMDRLGRGIGGCVGGAAGDGAGGLGAWAIGSIAIEFFIFVRVTNSRERKMNK